MIDRPNDETQASEQEDEHPLAQPSELAGTADAAIAAKFAARDIIDAQDADRGDRD